MPRFSIEAYEVSVQTYEVEGADATEALTHAVWASAYELAERALVHGEKRRKDKEGNMPRDIARVDAIAEMLT